MKTVGIIGGLGPETTSKFYLNLISSCQKVATQRPSLLIYNVPIPHELEKKEILEGKCSPETKSLLLKAAKILEKSGADFIVMPCNSLHVFAPEIQKVVGVPFLSLIETTVNFLEKKNMRQVGVLSTRITREKKLYENPLREKGIQPVTPSHDEQKILNEIVLKLTFGRYRKEDQVKLGEIMAGLKTKEVVLACTDLQLIVPDVPGITIYDTMNILADATLLEMLR